MRENTANRSRYIPGEFLLALLVPYALIVGAVVRLYYVLRDGFPLNDGGLFYTMVCDLQAAHYRLPLYTSYNAAGIPFAYPPLGFYLAGFVADLGPWSLLTVFRFLPLVLNVLTVVAFWALSRAMLGARAASAYALLAFSLMPHSFFWLIMGGGIARAPGLFFAVLALWQGYLLYTRQRPRYIATTAVLAGCAVLSHPSLAFFLAYSLALFFLVYGRRRRSLVHSLLVAVGTAALTAPWWGTILVRHGPTPFLSAWGTRLPTSVGLARLTLLALTDEPQFPLLGGLALWGLLASLRDRRFFWAAWLAAVFVLDARTAMTTATVPLAMLFGIGITEGLLPFLNRVGLTPAGDEGRPASAATNMLAVVVLFFVLAYATCWALTGRRDTLVALTPGEREAMHWIASHTPPNSTFLVITSPQVEVDWTAEWFPVLAERVSVTTYQGYEWLGRGTFLSRWNCHQLAQLGAGHSAGYLDAWRQETGGDFTHLYVAKCSTCTMPPDNTAGLRYSLANAPDYRVIYDGPAATVYQRVAGS